MSPKNAEFNKTALQLLEDLSGALPDNDDLATARLLATTLHSTNPNHTLAIDAFQKHAADHRDAIARGDVSYIVGVVRDLFPDPAIVDGFWGELSPENQQVVAEYVQALDAIAFDGDADPDTEADAGASFDNSHALHLIYNAAWRDLLVAVEMNDIVEKVDRLLDAKGKDSGVIMAIMDGIMEKVRETSIDAGNITSALVPPTDLTKAYKQDIRRIGKDMQLPLDTKQTMGEFLRKVSETARTWTMWHYIKTMVTVAKTCPPEVQTMMNQLIQGSDLF